MVFCPVPLMQTVSVKMEKKNSFIGKLAGGSVGTIALAVFIIMSLADSSYVCTGNQEVYEFDRISSSGLTGYPYKENNTDYY